MFRATIIAQRVSSNSTDNQEVLPFTTDGTRRKPGFFDYACANGTKSSGESVSTGRQSIGTVLHTKLPDHGFSPRRRFLIHIDRLERDRSYVTRESGRVSFGSRGGKKGGVYEEIKSYGPPEKRRTCQSL